MAQFRRGPMGPSMTMVEKDKDFKKTFKKLIAYCKPYWFVVIIALISSMIASILSIIGPDRLGEVTNLITEGIMNEIDIDAIIQICFWLLSLYSFSALLNFTQGFIMSTVTQKIAKSLREKISTKINRLPLKYFDNTSYGDVLSRITNDVDTTANTLSQSIVSLVSAITLLIGSLIMMLITDVRMTIGAVLATIVGFVLMVIIMGKSQKYFASQQQNLGEINGHIEEVYSGHLVVKAYNNQANVKKEFERINENLYSSAFKAQMLSGLMMPIMSFIGNFGYVVVCVLGGYLAMNNEISFGVIVSFMLYIRYFTQPLSNIAQAANNLQSTAAASKRVFEFLEEPELIDERNKTKSLENIKGEVEFVNVNFGYEKDKTIINDFSAIANSGQKVAIVGPTGAGKTTIVNLLMRFYEIDSGEILIDGVDISEITRENVHDLFCMVLQDTWIFEGTIKENIVYSKENISDEKIIEVCKVVGIHHFIQTLPDGYNTVLNDKANLSAGQKQLITIARAMIENAPLLILDEATSSVDTRTEILIQEAMDKLTIGRTSFVIAHRLSTIKNADLILVMNHGDIVESGNHETLLQQNGFYAELYNSQFETIG